MYSIIIKIYAGVSRTFFIFLFKNYFLDFFCFFFLRREIKQYNHFLWKLKLNIPFIIGLFFLIILI